MNREIHVRICESLRGQFPRATRPDRPCCLTLSNCMPPALQPKSLDVVSLMVAG
jgi:hypothetical protein